MIYIYDGLSRQYLYVNKNHIIHASKLVGSKIYRVYLTNGRKILVSWNDFERILKELGEGK